VEIRKTEVERESFGKDKHGKPPKTLGLGVRSHANRVGSPTPLTPKLQDFDRIRDRMSA
jgi:hypothetical protein